jgi:hypothetical protein
LEAQLSSIWESFPPLPFGTLVGVRPSWGNDVPTNITKDFFTILDWGAPTSKRFITIVHLNTGKRYQVYPDEIVHEKITFPSKGEQ